jgi:DNA repair photolyase
LPPKPPFPPHKSDRKLPLITPFDPWKSSLCTCPPKLTLNPYTGCDHNCVYCYAQNYIPHFAECRPKKDLLKRLQREAAKLNGETISLSNSSDPYPRIEKEAGLTRECLRILAESKCRIQIITKSTQVTRDIDILKEVKATVALTITTTNGDVAKIIEPNAPTPAERLRTVETLTDKGIAVAVRIDPIIPFVNEENAELIVTLATLGVRHVTASTYKPRQRDWRRFAAVMPETAEKLKPLYWSLGERVNGCVLLPKELRLKVLSDVRRLVLQHGMQFGVCREGLSGLNTAACDGSWLLPKRVR